MADDTITETAFTDGEPNNDFVRRCILDLSERKRVPGIAVVTPEVDRSGERLSYAWAFHSWRSGWFEPLDYSKPEGPDNRVAVQAYDSRPLIRFGPFDTAAEAIADVELTVTPSA